MYRSITKKELCKLYNISYHTLNKALEKVPGLINPKGAHTFLPADIKKIFAHLGEPDEVIEYFKKYFNNLNLIN